MTLAYNLHIFEYGDLIIIKILLLTENLLSTYTAFFYLAEFNFVLIILCAANLFLNIFKNFLTTPRTLFKNFYNVNSFDFVNALYLQTEYLTCIKLLSFIKSEQFFKS